MTTIRYNTTDEIWEEVGERQPNDKTDIQLPNFLIEKLNKVKLDVKNDMDVTAICVGGVGTGKSTLMRLCCRYVSDEKFNPREHIIQDVDDIKAVMKNAKPGDAILIDESSGIFGSADTLTKKTKYANLVLDVCRQKNLFIALAAPYFHRLGSSVAIDRSKFLLRVYLHKKTGKRGHMAYYSEKRKEQLYHFSKKNMGSIKGVKPNWRGNFGDDITHKELYKKVKDQTLNKVLDSLNGPDELKVKVPTPTEIKKEYRDKLIASNMDTPAKELAAMLCINERTVYRIKKDIQEQLSARLPYDPSITESPKLISDTHAQYINTYPESENLSKPTERHGDIKVRTI